MKIQSVNEAFSMEPAWYQVGTKCNGIIIKEIKRTIRPISNDLYECYEGYDKDNNVLFSLLATSANVTYEKEEK